MNEENETINAENEEVKVEFNDQLNEVELIDNNNEHKEQENQIEVNNEQTQKEEQADNIEKKEDVITNDNVEQIKLEVQENINTENTESNTSNVSEETKQKSEQKKIGKFKKFFQYVKKIILCIIIIFLSILIYRAYRYNSTEIFGYRLYVILSGSMEAGIHIGDGIVTAKPVEEIKIGDIIAFEYGNSITVHRVVDIIEDNGDNKIYQTKGDNNNADDPFAVSSDAIKGIYKFRIPYLGKTVLWIKNNIPIVVGAIAILFVLIIFKKYFF